MLVYNSAGKLIGGGKVPARFEVEAEIRPIRELTRRKSRVQEELDAIRDYVRQAPELWKEGKTILLKVPSPDQVEHLRYRIKQVAAELGFRVRVAEVAPGRVALFPIEASRKIKNRAPGA
jgi:archaellum biogenesis ATPase FlaH